MTKEIFCIEKIAKDDSKYVERTKPLKANLPSSKIVYFSKFQSSSAYNDEMESSKGKKFHCDIGDCKKFYSSQYRLKIHLRVHVLLINFRRD
jgi:hypothetical protein